MNDCPENHAIWLEFLMSVWRSYESHISIGLLQYFHHSTSQKFISSEIDIHLNFHAIFQPFSVCYSHKGFLSDSA